MHLKNFGLLMIVATLSLTPQALACDLCSIYSAQNVRDNKAGAFTLGAVEQISSFRTLQDNGDKVSNTEHQSLISSVTQLYGRYDFSNELGLQLNIPLITRKFRRPEGEMMQSGTESGVGDISALALYSPVRISEDDFFLRLTFRGGVKLPTGDTSRIKEETQEGGMMMDASSTDSEQMLKHGDMHGEGVASGIHGHDLALGSGSFDYILGVSSFVEKGKYFSIADLQYSIRTEGDYDYRYQNDLLWSLGAGRYLVTDHDKTISLRANLSGEYKGMDVFQGNKADDTGLNSIFLGPEINFTVGEKVFGLIALDLPVLIDNTALQLVTDYRIRVGVTYRF